MADNRHYYAEGVHVMDRKHFIVLGRERVPGIIATCVSVRMAKLLANALNIYQPRIRRRNKSAEKAVSNLRLSGR